MSTKAKGTVQLNLSPVDARSLVFLIRKRQEYCRQIGPEFPTHADFAEIDVWLEGLKSRVTSQLSDEVLYEAGPVKV